MVVTQKLCDVPITLIEYLKLELKLKKIEIEYYNFKITIIHIPTD